jgi:hypothetical protein
MQVFGRRHDEPFTPFCGRRPKSAKARCRGKLALAVLRALWGFDSGAVEIAANSMLLFFRFGGAPFRRAWKLLNF